MATSVAPLAPPCARLKEGMRDEFNPEVGGALRRVADGLPDTFKPMATGS